MTDTGKTSRSYLSAAILFAVIPLFLFVLLYDSNVHGPVDFFHNGESLAPASETLRGKLPFRDVYLQHGWGVNLIRTRLAFALFGPTLEAQRKLIYGVSGYLIPLAWISIYLLLYSLFRRKTWMFLALGLLFFVDVIVIDRHLFPFLSLTALAVCGKDSRLPLFIAGAFAAISVFYSLDTGLYALAIGPAFILLSSVCVAAYSKGSFAKTTLFYIGGVFAGALPFGVYLIWHGIGDDFLINCYLQLRYQTTTWGVSPPSISSLFGPFENSTERNKTIYLVVKWYYPVLAYACVSLFLLPKLVMRKLSESDRAILLITLAGLVFYRSAIGRADESHLMYAITPFWILNICFLERAIGLIRSKRETPENQTTTRLDKLDRICLNYISVCAVVVGLAAYFWFTCRNGGIIVRQMRQNTAVKNTLGHYVNLSFDRAGGVKVPPKQAKEIEETVAFIITHSKPDEPVFDFSNQGAYYFLADRANPTSFSQVAYAIPAPMQSKALKQLKDSPPALILMRDDEIHRPTEMTPDINDWILDNFHEAIRVGKNIILLPAKKSDEETSPN